MKFFLRKDDLKPYLRARRVGPKNRTGGGGVYNPPIFSF